MLLATNDCNESKNSLARYSLPVNSQVFNQSILQPTYALNKVHSEAIIKLLHVLAPGCHHQGVIQNKGVTRPTANLGIVSPFLK
jgi:hypothetical protein